MAKAYYSTVFEQPAQDIWKIIRDFNNYTGQCPLFEVRIPSQHPLLRTSKS